MNVHIPQIDENITTLNPCSELVRILNLVYEIAEDVYFDFGRCGFITPDGIILLAGSKMIRDQKGYKTKIIFSSINSDVNWVLRRWGFLDLFPAEEVGRRYINSGNSIPLHGQSMFNKSCILEYIDDQILNRAEMPKMSEILRKEIRKSFFEIFNNIFFHSDSPIGGLACGQIFPRGEIIQIVFYDAGIGIANKVREQNKEILVDKEAIEWSLQRGTSTLGSESISRGLGLFLLRKFLCANKGTLRIYANRGLFFEKGDERYFIDVDCPLKGTIIDIRIKIKEDVEYVLASEYESL
ncbi:MAG: hypothetical protein P9M06_01980 [Candidatus Saelkia tenebricola]|nr:hypothetical protein [Candidatus Saelkia tenebricola]